MEEKYTREFYVDLEDELIERIKGSLKKAFEDAFRVDIVSKELEDEDKMEFFKNMLFLKSIKFVNESYSFYGELEPDFVGKMPRGMLFDTFRSVLDEIEKIYEEVDVER